MKSMMLPQVIFPSSRHASNPGRMLVGTSRIWLVQNQHWEHRRKKSIKLLLLSRSFLDKKQEVCRLHCMTTLEPTRRECCWQVESLSGQPSICIGMTRTGTFACIFVILPSGCQAEDLDVGIMEAGMAIHIMYKWPEAMFDPQHVFEGCVGPTGARNVNLPSGKSCCSK